MAKIIVLGLLFGIINTMLLHLAKAMERYGIEIYSRKKSLKEKGDNWLSSKNEKNKRKGFK